MGNNRMTGTIRYGSNAWWCNTCARWIDFATAKDAHDNMVHIDQIEAEQRAKAKANEKWVGGLKQTHFICKDCERVCVVGTYHSCPGRKEQIDPKDYATLNKAIRTFESGATRDTDEGKLVYEAFLSPRVLRRFAEYMHKNRKQKDGSIRDGDNWQKGFPLKSYQDSLIRHVLDAWYEWRKGGAKAPALEELLCAIMFNTMGYLHELVKEREDGKV